MVEFVRGHIGSLLIGYDYDITCYWCRYYRQNMVVHFLNKILWYTRYLGILHVAGCECMPPNEGRPPTLSIVLNGHISTDSS